MGQTNERRSDSRLLRAARMIAWIAIGVISVGIAVVLPLGTVLVIVIVVSHSRFTDAVYITLGILVLTASYWGLVWWSEKNGLARWNEDEVERVETEVAEEEEQKRAVVADQLHE